MKKIIVSVFFLNSLVYGCGKEFFRPATPVELDPKSKPGKDDRAIMFMFLQSLRRPPLPKSSSCPG